MKLPRFLIADNPMVEGSPSAIIHTVHPCALILIDGEDLKMYWIDGDMFDAKQEARILRKARFWLKALRKFQAEKLSKVSLI